MKKKIFSILFAVIMLVPCLMLTGCGKIKELSGKTLIYAKVVVSESLNKDDYKDEYKNTTLTFTEDGKVIIDDGTDESTSLYKFENGKVYIKAETDEDYPEDAFAEIDGKYLVHSQTVSGGVIKIYFKVK